MEIERKECHHCTRTLSPFQEWHSEGGQLAWCVTCGAFYIVTSLPQMRYGVIDSKIGEWFVDVSSIGHVGKQISLFTDVLKTGKFSEARKGIENTTSHAGRMLLEVLFYSQSKNRIAQNELSTHLHSTFDFLLSTDPSTYRFPIKRALPEGSYGYENPIQYVPHGYSLAVFSPNIGMILRDLYSDAIRQIAESFRHDERLIARRLERRIADETFHRWNALSRLIHH